MLYVDGNKNNWSSVIWQKKGKFVCALKRFCLKEIHACCHTFIHNTKAILLTQ